MNNLIKSDMSDVIERNETDPLTGQIIGAAIDVHRALGPGLLESAYEACLEYELRIRRLRVEVQRPLPIFYKDVVLDCGYRLDLVVEKQVIVEIYPKCFKIWEFSKDFALIFAGRSRRPKKVLYWI